ncbi:MAG TPA: hypothetical protein VF884_06630 [Nitrososphaeraceae archaeon]
MVANTNTRKLIGETSEQIEKRRKTMEALEEKITISISGNYG